MKPSRGIAPDPSPFHRTIMDKQQHILLIGAGLAGSLLAVYLAKRGFRVDVYERRPDMRTVRMSAGKSINLALSARGIHPLREVGLYDEIAPILIPMRGRMIHPVAGGVVFSPYGKDEHESIHSVSRAELNMRLMDLAEGFESVSIHFNQRCTGIDLGSGTVRLRDETSGREYAVSGDTVIGTDGSASAIRLEMQKGGRFDYRQDWLEHGYKELLIPPAADGSFQLDPGALHIWPRRSYMLIALPNTDRTFTCTLFFPFEGEPSFASIDTPERLRAWFAEQFADAVPLMPTLEEDFFGNPTSSLVTVRCSPWHSGGRVALLGDAAHAVVPFFGQGMNCSFEDCSVLDECIGRHGADWDTVFREYHLLRKRNADAIADLALENFVEMRDKVADPRFLLSKAVGLALEQRFPERFVPKYSMVSFHRIPYAVALRRGRVQDDILERLCEGIARVEDVDWNLAERLLVDRLLPFHQDIAIN